MRDGSSLSCGLAILLALLGSGCTKPVPFAVSGTVTLDGEPLDEARVLFIPQEPGRKKTGGVIKQGQFRLPAVTGLLPGKYLVQIVDAPPDHLAPDAVASRRKLPERYARSSPYSVEVAADGQGDFDFQLTTTP